MIPDKEGWWVDFVAIPVFSSDGYWTLQSGSSSQSLTPEKWDLKYIYKIQNKAVVCFSQWYNFANMQTPVSNVTFDDHTESGQSVPHVVMTVMLTLQINFKKKTADRMENGCGYFHITMTNRNYSTMDKSV